MPIMNWFELKKGNYQALYKFNLINYVPLFFQNIESEMIFQFENLDLTLLRKKSRLVVLYSIAERTKNKSIKFQADVLANEIKNKEKQETETNEVTLNSFIDYIEMTFNSIGSIDPTKMSTSRAFSLYNKAIERNKINNKKNVNNSK